MCCRPMHKSLQLADVHKPILPQTQTIHLHPNPIYCHLLWCASETIIKSISRNMRIYHRFYNKLTPHQNPLDAI
ncbi:hypothetical protein HanIR_Chr15g0751321 [Helianthus annuus]|nr:hypothetical protein HanIR_Chr15g0751321 [Helianthus annuus]